MNSKNIILCVLVAILAAVSAVFAFLIMQRNTVVRKGWENLSGGVYRTAQIMDKDSGKPVSGQLSAQKLAISDAENVGNSLKALEKRAQDLVKERDDLADALRHIAQRVGVREIPSDADMRGLDTYAAGKDKVVVAVDQALSSRDKVYKKLADVSRTQLGAEVKVEDLRNGNTQAITPLTEAIERNGQRCRTYEKGMSDIGRAAGSSAAFDASDANYQSSIGKVQSSVSDLRSEKGKLQGELSDAKRTIERKDAALDESKKEVEKKQSEISDRDQAIRSYKLALGLAEDAEHEMPWKEGSAEARRAVKGQVISVNADYGFVTVNLGTKTMVSQKLGNKSLPVNPVIEKGMEVVVSRGALGDDAAFVARLTLDGIGGVCSTADIPSDCAEIKVGDFVYISL